MGRSAILLIGAEKTGTTTLQHFLAANREMLARKGFVYPSFCGAVNHTGLAAYAMDPGKRDPLRGPFGAHAEADVEPMRARLRAAAESELKSDATVIFSSEHCHSRLTTAAEVATLRDFLRGFFDDIRIGVYLRRQDQVALSLYSTRLKSGASDRSILPCTDTDDPYFNYDRSLSLWEDAFGRENIHVRIFDRKTLIGGSVVSDCLAAWKLGNPRDFAQVPNQNESILPEAQEFLRLVNPCLEPLGDLPIDEVLGPLTFFLEQLFPGRGARPARAEAETFYSCYDQSNEAVRQRYFPDRARLFDADFADYPETADHRDFGPDALARIAAAIHMAANRELRRLKAEVAIRDAKLHWLRDEPEAGERAMDRALAWKPDFAEAYRTLAEQMLRRDRLAEAAAAARRAAELRPDAHEYWHFLGMLLVRTGDLAGAAAAQGRAFELDPKHAPSERELGQVLIRLADAAQPSTDGPASPATTPEKRSPMRTVAFSLTQAHLEALARHGLQLEGLLHTRRLAETSRIEAPTAILARTTPGAFIDVGAFCSLSGGSGINNVRIGRYCSIAGGVKIGLYEHPTDWLTTSRITHQPNLYGWDALMAGTNAPTIYARREHFRNSCPITTLEPDVWIGYGAFIKAGVNIGTGAIVAAHATVVRDVPPYTIVGGTPAKALRLRFHEPIVERLLQLEWWRYSIFDLFDAPFSRVEEALDAIETLIASGAVQPFAGSEVRPADLADPLAFAGARDTLPLAQVNGHTH